MTPATPDPQPAPAPPAAAAPPKPDAPTDAINAFEDAFLKVAAAGPANTADAAVGDVFALGWQMAELYRPDRRREQAAAGDGLRGFDALDDGDRMEIILDQVQVHLVNLRGPIERAELPVPDLAPVRTSLAAGEPAADAVRALHRQLLGTLLAVDFRLGKAYGLGRAIADLCRNPTSLDELRAALAPQATANLLGWLDDLSTAFPHYAAHSVGTSLSTWRDRAKDLAAVGAAEDTLSMMRRQGELWRALLTGEKNGHEMLEIDNYLAAAGNLAGRMHSVLTTAIGRFWPLLCVAGVLLVGGLALVFVGGSSQIVAGAGSILVALGLTWKGLGGTLGRLAGKLEQPLWGAVLDCAISQAITLLPPIDLDHDHAQRAMLARQMPSVPGPGGKPDVRRSAPAEVEL